IETLMVIKEYESVIGVFGRNANYRVQTLVGYIYNQLSSSHYNLKRIMFNHFKSLFLYPNRILQIV
ncbi:MAG: hypothetical protein Q8842_02965, partial [Candidatus Phytoplasma australasiaticum]|nr:hypothetical protein [Candidatus Phytoplasma australasiaticum]